MPRLAQTKTQATMTRLSGCWSPEQCVRRAAHLARGSLLTGAMGALASGCLDAPPTYSAPVQSPPFILGSQVKPDTISVQTVILSNPQTPVHLIVPFRSIDAGEDLVGILFADYDPSKSQTEINNNQWIDAKGSLPADPRPLDEQVRDVKFDWDPSPSRFHGCHTITLQLAHESTFPIDPTTGQFQPGKSAATNPSDIAQITWYFDVRDPSDTSQPTCWGRQ